MLADIQSQLTSININILMTTPIEFKDRIKLKRYKAQKARLMAIANIPIEEIDEHDLNTINGC